MRKLKWGVAYPRDYLARIFCTESTCEYLEKNGKFPGGKQKEIFEKNLRHIGRIKFDKKNKTYKFTKMYEYNENDITFIRESRTKVEGAWSDDNYEIAEHFGYALADVLYERFTRDSGERDVTGQSTLTSIKELLTLSEFRNPNRWILYWNRAKLEKYIYFDRSAFARIDGFFKYKNKYEILQALRWLQEQGCIEYFEWLTVRDVKVKNVRVKDEVVCHKEVSNFRLATEKEYDMYERIKKRGKRYAGIPLDKNPYKVKSLEKRKKYQEKVTEVLFRHGIWEAVPGYKITVVDSKKLESLAKQYDKEKDFAEVRKILKRQYMDYRRKEYFVEDEEMYMNKYVDLCCGADCESIQSQLFQMGYDYNKLGMRKGKEIAGEFEF